jgi:hypothetical protein
MNWIPEVANDGISGMDFGTEWTDADHLKAFEVRQAGND